jgi:predicted RNase H-like nuclease (RuvC/YqgF family)
LKEEQLRAAAAAEAEAARMAQLAAQHQAHIERLEQELEALRARLEQKSEQINRLENAREVAVQGYCTPQKFSLEKYSLTEQLESESESEAGEEKYDFRNDYEDERGVHPNSRWTQQHLAKLWKDDKKIRNRNRSSRSSRSINGIFTNGRVPHQQRTRRR